ncbi:MAG: adenylate/guanylate cyclase domain-containing protein [Acidimicrobiales bacterium]
MRPFYERLAERLLVVRYNGRGTGMSQRDVVDLSPEAAERDLLAVVDRLGLDRFAMYDHVLAGPGPANFAARHPDRVTSLVWWVGQTVAISAEVSRRLAAMGRLMESDWDLYCDVVGRLICGWDAPDAPYMAELIRAGSSPGARRAALAMWLRPEDEHLGALETMEVPALVAHIAGAPMAAVQARQIAQRIPDAHVIAVPGHPQSTMPIGDDNPVLVAAIADFVEAATAPGAPAVPQPELQLAAMRAILWTDVVGHTLLMDRLGDTAGREVLREHEELTRHQLAAHGGTEVKAMGDGFMAWFGSAQRALDCAIDLQRSCAARNSTATEPFEVRAGLNAGEPILEDDDLFGTSVIAAARICGMAGAGEIIVSDVVRQLVAGKSFEFVERGSVDLKGFQEPVRLCSVQWDA